MFLVTVVADLHAANVCDAALVLSTYNSFSSDHIDWRIATLVTEKEWDQIKHDQGSNAVIYGIPVGETYSDFESHVHDKLSSYGESLTHDQSINILWTGLDPNGANAYADCLRTQLFISRGLHLAVSSATKNDISLLVSWNPQGSDPATIAPVWVWRGSGKEQLPNHLQQGLTTVVVTRPPQVHTLAINYPGFTDSVVIEPLSKLPILPQPAAFSTSVEVYKSDNVASGACKDFGAWASVCSADKPEGWSIASQIFQLTGDRAGCSFAQCELVSPATATKVCYHFRTQGHDEECGHSGNTGIHYSMGVLTVTWQHH